MGQGEVSEMSPVLGNVQCRAGLESKALTPGQALLSLQSMEIKTTGKTAGTFSFSRPINIHQQH